MPYTPFSPPRFSGEAIPEDFSLLAWTFNPLYSASTVALATAGTVYTSRIYIHRPMTITNIVTHVNTAGGTLTSGQCFLGLFDSAGTLLSATADQAAAWAGTGKLTAALTVAQTVGVGFVDVGAFFNGTTGPTLPRLTNNAVNSTGLTTTAIRYATADTGRTTSFATPLGAKTLSAGNALWFALS